MKQATENINFPRDEECIIIGVFVDSLTCIRQNFRYWMRSLCRVVHPGIPVWERILFIVVELKSYYLFMSPQDAMKICIQSWVRFRSCRIHSLPCCEKVQWFEASKNLTRCRKPFFINENGTAFLEGSKEVS